MSDKVASVIAPVPVAAPGRVNAFVQPGAGGQNNGARSQQQAGNAQGVGDLQDDVVTLQSGDPASAQASAEAGTASHQAPELQAQAAAEAAARIRAQIESESRQKGEQSLQDAASTLDSYFSQVHPDVNFRLDQQAGGMVVLVVDSLNGKVLQAIPGDEARQLAKSLFGSASLLPKKV